MAKLTEMSQWSNRASGLNRNPMKEQIRQFLRQSQINQVFKNIWRMIKYQLKGEYLRFPYQRATEWGLTAEPRNPRLIVSLTSYPTRINTVPLTINTLLRQTLKPDMLVLWLGEDKFPKQEAELPEDLLALRDLGLTIKWCQEIRSFAKLVPSLREFPK